MEVLIRKRNSILYKRTANIEVGDRVQLYWYGDSNIPQWLQYSWGTVVRIKRTGTLVVKADMDAYGLRDAVPDRHICDHVPSTEDVDVSEK